MASSWANRGTNPTPARCSPTSVAATIEPVVGALLALLLFKQQLSLPGWLGLTMVVGGVAMSYLSEAKTGE